MSRTFRKGKAVISQEVESIFDRLQMDAERLLERVQVMLTRQRFYGSFMSTSRTALRQHGAQASSPETGPAATCQHGLACPRAPKSPLSHARQAPTAETVRAGSTNNLSLPAPNDLKGLELGLYNVHLSLIRSLTSYRRNACNS